MSNAFEDRTQTLLREFVQTVAFVDDQIYITSSPGDPHAFDLEKTSKDCSGAGLFFTAFQPSSLDDVSQAASLVIKSDVSVLDWRISLTAPEPIEGVDDEEVDDVVDERGKFTKEVIKEAFCTLDDRQQRLVFIYTGESDLNTILQSIKDLDPENFEVDGEDPFVIKKGGLRICIWAKAELETQFEHIPDNKARVRSYSELVEEIVPEYSKMTNGLLSNACLTSINAIRCNTNRIISTFNPQLDSAYLTHRSLLPVPSDAEEQFYPLFSDVINAIVQDADTGANISESSINDYFDSALNSNKQFRNYMKLKKSNIEAVKKLKELVKKGIQNISPSKIKKQTPSWGIILEKIKSGGSKKSITKLTQAFSCSKNPECSEKVNNELSILFSMVTHYHTFCPKLTLGTIVKQFTGEVLQYFVCLQPRCDGERVNRGGRSFLFLPMKVSVDDTFDFVIKEGEGYIYLKADTKSFLLKSFMFKPNKANSPIIAQQDDKKWIFTAHGSENKFIYLCDLKPEFAQRLANSYAANLSRVGLSESEWQRRSAK